MTAVKTAQPKRTSREASGPSTARVAVIAHRRKSLGGGLLEPRSRLRHAKITDPAWFEVPKSKKAPEQAHAAVKAGAELLLVWGGDGMVQRSIDAVGPDAALATAGRR